MVVRSPTIGRLAAQNDPDLGTVRRSFVNRTRYFIYYRINEDVLEILAVWHSARGEAPELG